MTELESVQLLSFQIIAAVGNARSLYLEAIQAAKQGDYQQANALIEEGNDSFKQGHDVHTQLVQREAAGDQATFSLMILHAEDQLMSAESFGILANEFIDVYRRIEEK